MATSNTQSSLEYELKPTPTDGITSMNIGENRYLLVSSWDSNLRVYDLNSKSLKTTIDNRTPVLDSCFFERNSGYFAGGLDNTIKLFDSQSGEEQLIGNHDKAVKCVEYSQSNSVLVSGSWDASIKLWDVRTNECTGRYQMPDKVFTMSSWNETLVIGTAGRHVIIYDLRNMKEPQQRRESSLKYQTRCIRCYPDGTGYAVSSIEGRVAMEYFDASSEAQQNKYAFKCHRININGVDTIYPVNCIAFHQPYGTFATGGCDGIVNVWDGHNKKRLHQYRKYPTSIAALAFSQDGHTLAVASSYTFEEGEKDHPEEQIFIRRVNDAEVLPKNLQK
eukprot:TRINITY_DN1326_c0_g5_i1.p1 TRINITY_DN1326_c0_g5~~TRINITY_DN1326_c0_g5_i1.p1  ORF type:complete len:333 (+),score=61.75 TRINITY_DN1326_c0_g5_i1:105-1103(+)